jgi:cell division transport system permease protein
MSAVTRFSHAWREAGRLLRRRFPTFLLAVLLCASALALPLLAVTVGYALTPLAARAPVAPEASVFVSLSASNQDIGALKAKLEGWPGVQRVQWVTRGQSLADLARRAGGIAPLSDLKPNPLPDTLIVTFDRGIAPDRLEQAASDFRRLPRVDGVYVDSSWFRKLAGLIRVITQAALFVGGLVLVLLVLVVIGAVRLVAVTDSDELRLLHLLGADEHQLARPFAYVGGLTLFTAAALAAATVAALLGATAPDLAWLGAVLGLPLGIAVLPPAALAGLGVAAFAAGMVGGSVGVRSALRRII